MPSLLLNKPWGVLCQFTDAENRPTLADYIDQAGVYAAGRLDRDSEGALLLTDDGALNQSITRPGNGTGKRYLAQVEGRVSELALRRLRQGVNLKDGYSAPAQVRLLPGKPGWLWPRQPPIRYRKNIPTAWLELILHEGRNRQVRRMCAAVDLPVLRLVRSAIGPLQLDGLKPGQWRQLSDEDIAQLGHKAPRRS